ncbi:hypothetical protein PR202_gb27077 [Eleusine coracana subsp. coracana]|uniref:RRM domain-containing protein n=1 Tax=Eleusine coracana subsp. coracana TaxID=191504 RepID=A0AAV5FQV9_ELECO|nr:hypothetical protein PR202_gb27077 [Eleusine coracana subsp. coracana]
MAAVAEGSAPAAAKQVEYQSGVQKLMDLLSNLNPAAKEFVPSSAAAAAVSSPSKKALSADAPVFEYKSTGGGNGETKDSAGDATFAVGNQQRRIVDCRICGDPHSVLRFAFVEFADDDGARAALNLDGTIFGFYPVRVMPSKTAILPVNPKYLPRTEDEKEMVMRTVYCTNIDKMITELDVMNFFEEFCGEVSA